MPCHPQAIRTGLQGITQLAASSKEKYTWPQLRVVLDVVPMLHSLVLSKNKLTDDDAEGLAAALQGNGTLRDLNLFGNRIGPAGATALSTVLPPLPPPSHTSAVQGLGRWQRVALTHKWSFRSFFVPPFPPLLRLLPPPPPLLFLGRRSQTPKPPNTQVPWSPQTHAPWGLSGPLHSPTAPS